MGRPKKNLEVEEIEKEAGLTTTAVVEPEKPVVTSKVYDEDDGYNIEIVEDPNAPADVFMIPKPDVGYEYRGIYFGKDENVSLRTGNMLYQGGGWQLCPKQHLLKIGYKESDIGPDGLLHRGDLVLARIPKHLYQKKMEEKRKKAVAPMDAIQRMIKKGDPTRGGSTVHPTMKGLQTKEQLGNNFGKDEE